MARGSNPAPEFDFASLSVEKTEMPAAKSGRAAGPNPFVKPLGESFENDEGRQVVVPANVLRRTLYLIRAAANELGIGARIVVLNSKGETVEQKKDAINALRGNVTVKFAGKERKARKSDEDAAEDAAEDVDTDEAGDEDTDAA